MTTERAKADLQAIFSAAIAACHSDQVVARHLPPRPPDGGLVFAAGKAAAGMARALEYAWGPPLDGLVVTRHRFDIALDYLPQITASHPVPDQTSERAAMAMLAKARSARPDQIAILLLSGGASALLAAPALGNSLNQKMALTRDLLASGASIHEINCVRRHLSRIKGGRLAAACPAPLLTLAISDVVGDSPHVIGSGLGVADPSTIADARQIMQRYGIDDSALNWDETIKPRDLRLARSGFQIIARAHDLIDAASQQARRLGYRVEILGYDLEGEASAVGRSHGQMALDRRTAQDPIALISGGELTVTMNRPMGLTVGKAQGGPNQEYALGLALALAGAADIYALAADSDGIDGNIDAAGGFIDPDLLVDARQRGIDPAEYLARHDSGSAFEKLDRLFKPGPTQTNVNDLRIILINPRD